MSVIGVYPNFIYDLGGIEVPPAPGISRSIGVGSITRKDELKRSDFGLLRISLGIFSSNVHL